MGLNGEKLKGWIASKVSQAGGAVKKEVRSEYQSYKKKRLQDKLAREEGRAVMREAYEKAKGKQYEKYGKLKVKYELEPEMERLKEERKYKKKLERHGHEVLWGGMGTVFGSKSKVRVSDGIGSVNNMGFGLKSKNDGIGNIGFGIKPTHDGIGSLSDIGFGFKKRKRR